MNSSLTYVSLAILLTGIIIYLYNLIVYYKDKEYERYAKSKTVWIYGLFIIMLLLFVLIYNSLKV
jgi:hypothetical protein